VQAGRAMINTSTINKNDDEEDLLDDEDDRLDDEDDRLDEEAACRFIGGSKPIDPSTLWRGVRAGIYSPPEKISAQSVRFRRHKLARDLARLNERGD
jgi:hypothetical protein